jgi:hypothetical protein
MSSVRRVLLTIALGAALGAGPAIAAPAMAQPNNNGNNNSTKLAALLTDRGLQGGDEDGWGAVNLSVRSNGRVCFTYFIQRVDNAHNLTLYRNGGNGGVELADGSIGQGCRKVSWKTAWALRKWPSQFYVQVEGNNGPIRGRLFRNGGGNNDW